MFDNLNQQRIQQFFQNGTTNSELDLRRDEISLNFTVTSCQHRSDVNLNRIVTSEGSKILKVATDEINKFDNWINQFSTRNQDNLHTIGEFLSTHESIETGDIPLQQLHSIQYELRKKNIYQEDDHVCIECSRNRLALVNLQQNHQQVINNIQYQLNQVLKQSEQNNLKEHLLNSVQRNLLEEQNANLKNKIEKQKFQRSTLFTKTKHLESQLKHQLQKSKGLSAAKNSTSSSDIIIHRNHQSSLFIDPYEFDIQDWVQVFITKKETYSSKYKREIREFQKKIDKKIQEQEKKGLKKEFRSGSQTYQIYQIFRNIVMGLQLIKKMRMQTDIEYHPRSMLKDRINVGHEGECKQVETVQSRREILKLNKIISGLTREKQYLQETLCTLRQNIMMQRTMKGQLQDTLQSRQSQIEELCTEMNSLEQENIKLRDKLTDGFKQKEFITIKGKLNGLEQIYMKVNAEKKQLEIHVKELQYKLNKEKSKRKYLHNEIEDIKGSQRVYCRVRPKLSHQTQMCNIIRTNGDRVMVDKRSDKLYRFDGVFDGKSNQQQVFQDIDKLVQSAFDGHNISIMAYGQTGSGKTYTLHGNTENLGIAPRVIIELFHICELQQNYYNIIFQIQMVEIYNERIIDLLRTGKQAVEIKQEQDGRILLQHCTSIKINKQQQMQHTYLQSMRNRKIRNTDQNIDSSRSHVILIITINMVNIKTSQELQSKINIIDLAGAQKLISNDPKIIRECNFINKSLNNLTICMNAIINKQQQIPYKDSKLTYLLKDSLNYYGKTIIFINLCPTENNKEQSINSLYFGSKIKNIDKMYIPRKCDSVNDSKNNSREVSKKSTIKL